MSSFSVGDLAVRIDDESPVMPKGTIARVIAVSKERALGNRGSPLGYGIKLAGWPCPSAEYWHECRFEKLRPADAGFTLRMRACQPHKVSA